MPLQGLTSWDTSEEGLDALVAKLAKESDGKAGFYIYGLSKAAATTYMMILAKKFKQEKTGIRAACLTPGNKAWHSVTSVSHMCTSFLF